MKACLLLRYFVGLVILIVSCEPGTKRTVAPHDFTFNRAEMPRLEKPDFFEGDIGAVLRYEANGYPIVTYLGKCKGYTIFHYRSYSLGNDYSIYDSLGFLTFHRYGGCDGSNADSLYYLYDKTARVLYQIAYYLDIEYKWSSNDSCKPAYDTNFYFFDDRQMLRYKVANDKCRKRIELTTYTYNKNGRLRSEYTRRYNDHFLELTEEGKRRAFYHYSGGRKDSVVTWINWDHRPAWKQKTKVTYTASGDPDSFYLDDKFYYRYRIVSRKEFLKKCDGKEPYIFDETGRVMERL